MGACTGIMRFYCVQCSWCCGAVRLSYGARVQERDEKEKRTDYNAGERRMRLEDIPTYLVCKRSSCRFNCDYYCELKRVVITECGKCSDYQTEEE